MVATASFHQVLGHMARSEPGGALRPYLLVAVRDMVRGWSSDDRISDLMPELRKPTGGRGMRAARSMTPEKRQLAERSFRALPGVAQCLLWHTEVEAENISIPAGLSGLDSGTAAAALEQARDEFRAGIVRAHRQLAPTQECPFYNRLLDVPIRRGGALLPDVQHHLTACRHCRYAAEQLGQFEGGLGTLLAEAVLGWGARRYLESRPGRGGPVARTAGAAAQGGRLPGGGGRHRHLSHMPLPGAPLAPPRTHARALRTGAALGSAALLAIVLVTSLSSGDDSGGPAASVEVTGMTDTGMVGSPGVRPGAGSETASAGSSSPVASPTAAGHPGGPGRGRLRNVAADLCLDVRGGTTKAGAKAEPAECSSAASQQWLYAESGLLSSVAHPGLCLDSHADNGAITLDRCAAPSAVRADEVRYDLTAQGELLPRWHEGLAVALSSSRKGAKVVVEVRDGSVEQRWMLDSSAAPAPGPGANAGTTGPSAKSVTDAPPADGDTDSDDDGDSGGSDCAASTCERSSPGEKGAGANGDESTDDGPEENGPQSSPNSLRRADAEKRYVEVGCCGGAGTVAPEHPGDRLRFPRVRVGALDGVPRQGGPAVREMPAPSPGRDLGVDAAQPVLRATPP